MANLRDLRKELAVLREQKATKDEIKKVEDQISAQEKRNAELAEKRAEAEKARAKFKQDILKADTKSRGIEKDILKLLDSQKGKLLERFGVINKENQLKLKNIKTQVLEELRNNKNLSKADKDRKLNAIKALNATGDLQKDILSDFEAGTIEAMSEEEILAKILEKAGLSQKEFYASSEEAQNTILEQVKKLSKSTETLSEKGFKEMFEYVTGIEDSFDPIIKKAKMFGDLMGNATLRTAALKAGLAAVAFSLAKDIFNSAKEVRQELGLGVGEAAALGAKITLAEKATKLMGGRAGEVQSFATGIAKEFGNVEQVSTGVTLQFAKIASFTGISGDAAAKLAKSIQIIQGGSLETSLNMIEVFEATARTAGVMPKLVLEDIANSTETFAKFAKDGGKNIAAAAAQAAKLGLNLDTVAGVAESLLDFESSIEKQLEAQLLTGRALNLDKARELSLAGDLEGLQKEIVNQVGTEADFQAMNVVQRKAMADALGVSVADLGKMVAGEKTSAEIAREKQEAEAAHMDMQKAMMIAQIGLMTTQVSLQGILMRRRIATAISGIFSSFSFIPAGLGLLAAGGVVAGMYGLIKAIPSLDKGGVVKESGMAEVHKGEVFSGAKNEMGFGADMTETNKILKDVAKESKTLREQNQFLLNKLIRTTGDMKLQNA